MWTFLWRYTVIITGIVHAYLVKCTQGIKLQNLRQCDENYILAISLDQVGYSLGVMKAKGLNGFIDPCIGAYMFKSRVQL